MARESGLAANQPITARSLPSSDRPRPLRPHARRRFSYATWYFPTRLDLLLLNVAGIFPFSLSYLALITWYHPRRRTFKWRIAGILAAMGAATGLLYGAVYAAVGTAPVARTILGSAAVVVNIGLFSSPVAAVYTAFRELDASRVPVTFTVVALACASLWAVFGILVGDVFLVVPNGVGALISLAQLVVLGVIKYKRGKAGLGGGGKAAVADASAAGAAAVPAGGRDVEAGGKPAAAPGGGALAAAASQHEVDAEPVMVMTATVPPTAVLHVVPSAKSREYSYSFADASSAGLGELAPPKPLGAAAVARAAGGGKAAAASGSQQQQQPPPAVPARAPSLAAATSKSASLLFTSRDGLMPSSSSDNLVGAGAEHHDDHDHHHPEPVAAAGAGASLAPIAVGLQHEDEDDADGGGESMDHIVRAVSRSLQQLSAAAAADGGGGGGRTRGASRVSSPALRAVGAAGAVPATPKLD